MSIAMRPKFYLHIPDLHLDEAIERIHDKLATPGVCCKGSLYYGNQFELKMLETERTTWSPELKLILESEEGEGIYLFGRFGPGASVWSMFMAGYAASLMTAGAGCIVLMSQMSLKGPMQYWSLYLVFGGLLGAALVYALARVGQSLAKPQMEKMHTLLLEIFPEAKETKARRDAPRAGYQPPETSTATTVPQEGSA